MLGVRSNFAVVPAFALLLCGRAAAQSSVPNTLPPQPPVYIVDFAQALGPELDREFEQLNNFTSNLIKLRLLEIPSLTVHSSRSALSCGAAASTVRQADQIGSAGSAPPEDFYEVDGSIKSDLPQITLSYSVTKCEGSHFKTVLQDAQPFTLDRAFEQISIVAEAIAFKIQQATPPTQVEVASFSVSNEPLQPKGMTTDLENAIEAELKKSPSYEVAESADYRVLGQLTFVRQHILGALPGRIDITADVQVEAHGKSYPLRQVRGSTDQLQKFYEEVSGEVTRGLPEVLIAEHLQLSGMLSSMKTDQLLTEANRLLDQCISSETQCASAQDAVTVLNSALGQDTTSWKLFFALGRAQTLAGKSGDAISSLKKALDLLETNPTNAGKIPTAEHVQVLNKLGEAYSDSRRYDQACNAYAESLELDSSQVAVYKNLAAAYEFQNQPGKAVESLIAGLKMCENGPECDPLHNSAKNLILSIPTEDKLQSLVQPVADAWKASAPVTNEYALLTARKLGLTLDNGWFPERQAEYRQQLQIALDLHSTDPEAQAWVDAVAALVALNTDDSAQLHDFVAKAEQLPADQVPNYVREWIERIAAQSYVNAAQYDQAIESADRGYHIMPSDRGALLIADATLLEARCKERAWKMGQTAASAQICRQEDLTLNETQLKNEELTPSQRAEVQGMYNDVARTLAPLVGKRYQGADDVYMHANHSLGKDQETRDLYLGFTHQDASDQTAWNVVMYVCSQYLFDFNCAYSAASKSESTLAKTGPGAARNYLNIAETAVLSGNRSTALAWLGVAAGQSSLSAGDESLLHFYRLWTLMLAGHRADELKIDFDAWRDAAERFRASKMDIYWVFIGARTALNRSRTELGTERVTLLLSMIDALERQDTAIPAWPSSG